MRKTTKTDRVNEPKSKPADAFEQPPTASRVRKPKAPNRPARAAKGSAGKTASAKRGATGAKKQATKRSAVKAPATQEPSEADIRLRAYFIAERRVQLALKGDPARDWIEARQQLVEEGRQANPSG